MPVTSDQPSSRLTDAQVGEVLALVKGADSVELKLTVPDSGAPGGRRRWASTRSTRRSGRCTSSIPPTWRWTATGRVRARRVQAGTTTRS